MRLLILAAVITLAYGHTACPSLWTHFKGQCYRFFPDRLMYNDAATTCQQFAPCSGEALGQLTKITDTQTNAFLGMYLKGFDGTPGGFEAWQGLNDQRMNNNWEYGDGTALGVFRNWAMGQPDNGAQGGGQPENCATVNSETALWSDAQCQMMLPYVCMFPAEQERILIPRWNPNAPQNPNQPGMGNPGVNPGYNPNNPGYNPNNPGYNPNNPGTGYNPNRPVNPNNPNIPNNPNVPINPNNPNNPNQPRPGFPNNPNQPGRPI